MPVTDQDRELSTDLARRLFAAYTSYKIGNMSVDHIGKQYSDAPVGDLWIEVAKFIMDQVNRTPFSSVRDSG